MIQGIPHLSSCTFPSPCSLLQVMLPRECHLCVAQFALKVWTGSYRVKIPAQKRFHPDPSAFLPSSWFPSRSGGRIRAHIMPGFVFFWFILALGDSWGFIPPVSWISLSFHINFSLLCTVPGWVDEIMGLAVLFLASLSPYQMGAEHPLHLTKLHSRWILLSVGALLPRTPATGVCVFVYLICVFIY